MQYPWGQKHRKYPRANNDRWFRYCAAPASAVATVGFRGPVGGHGAAIPGGSNRGLAGPADGVILLDQRGADAAEFAFSNGPLDPVDDARPVMIVIESFQIVRV